jgi:DNA-binding transcriptional MerR regulator
MNYYKKMKASRAIASGAGPAPIPMNVLIQRSGIARQTIHFYMRKGLLPKPDATSRTYALYPPDTVDLLKIIKDCQTHLRLSLDEIVELFSRKEYRVERIAQEVALLKTNSGLSLSSSPAKWTDQSGVTVQALPAPDWIEELRRNGLIASRGEKLSVETAELAASISALTALGVRLEDLVSMAKDIREQADSHFSGYQRALESVAADSRPDYTAAMRIFNAMNHFADCSRKEAIAVSLTSKTFRSANIFVGNQKHLFPSETFVAKMGLSREIDRLLALLDRDPDNRKALVDLARTYYLRSDWVNLYNVSERILQLDPPNVRATADMTRAMFYLGRIEDAVRILEHRVRTNSDPLLKFRLGQCLVLRARRYGSASGLLEAIVRKQQLAAEAIAEAADQPGTRRWIQLDLALDNLSVSDPLNLNQPSVAELEELYREYLELPDKNISAISKMNLARGRLLVAYALYLVYRDHNHANAEKMRRKIVQMDPDCVLANRDTTVAVAASEGIRRTKTRQPAADPPVPAQRSRKSA